METFRQFLSARALSEALLMKHTEESARAERVIHGDICIADEFKRLADALGYDVTKREAPALQAAE